MSMLDFCLNITVLFFIYCLLQLIKFSEGETSQNNYTMMWPLKFCDSDIYIINCGKMFCMHYFLLNIFITNVKKKKQEKIVNCCIW